MPVNIYVLARDSAPVIERGLTVGWLTGSHGFSEYDVIVKWAGVK